MDYCPPATQVIYWRRTLSQAPPPPRSRTEPAAAALVRRAYGYDYSPRSEAEWGLAGNRTQLIYPGGQVVTNTYDAANRLLGVTDWAGPLTEYGYDGWGRVITTTHRNGVTALNRYDYSPRSGAERDAAAGWWNSASSGARTCWGATATSWMGPASGWR